MKLVRGAMILLAVAFFAAAAHQANATIYGDSSNDVFTTAGGGILDIQSVEVTSDGTDVNFKINVANDPFTPNDWGKYMIGINTGPGGSTTNNGWGRPITLSTGMNYWIGSWADSGFGVQLYQYSAGSWSQTGATGPFAGGPAMAGLTNLTGSSFMSITVPRTALGLSPTDSFNFDVYTSGGGGTDSAVDSLANPSQSISDWGIPYDSGLSDTFTIPEPSTFVLLGFGGLALLTAVRRRK